MVEKTIIEKNRLDSEETMREEIEKMHSFGSRITGATGHQAFIAWIKEQLVGMGLEVHSNHYTFDRWEEKSSSLSIEGEEIPISSVYPYSGETGAEGITGELAFIKNGNYASAKGKIAVVKIKVVKKLPIGLIMNKREAYPSEASVVASDGDLVLTSVLKNPHLKKAKEQGVKAVILVWHGVSDERVKDQYLPFTDDYLGIPALWVSESQGERVIEAARKKQQATLILEADKQEAAPTESFYVTLEGKNKNETVLVNTHTDGVNVVEENGAIGMLSMIRYLQQCKLERSFIFAFVTGHFRLPIFKGSSQATSTWLMDNPDVWDGKNGHKKAVAGITIEHLGSTEWKENDKGQYAPTGKLQMEYTYVGNKQLGEVWKKALEGRSMTRTILLRGHNKFQFGESQPLFEAGIPAIGLIQMPDYLMANSANGELDKLNVALMREQIESLLKAAILVDKLSIKELGQSDGYSYFFGKTR